MHTPRMKRERRSGEGLLRSDPQPLPQFSLSNSPLPSPSPQAEGNQYLPPYLQGSCGSSLLYRYPSHQRWVRGTRNCIISPPTLPCLNEVRFSCQEAPEEDSLFMLERGKYLTGLVGSEDLVPGARSSRSFQVYQPASLIGSLFFKSAFPPVLSVSHTASRLLSRVL